MLKSLMSVLFLTTLAHADEIKIFSANSRREVLAKNATKAIGFAKVGGCTGFFVKTTDTNRSFVSSSRHCFKYDADAWCKTGIARIHTTGQELKCLGVAAGTETHDTVLLEFQNIPRDRSGDFSYANRMPPVGSRLEMIGFPKDGFLTDRTVDTLISTHNCKVITTTGRNLYTNVPEVIDDEVFRHDCSTYGGNSGGPMMIEGTRTVVGIPDQYRPGSTPDTDLEDGRSIQGVRVDAYVADLNVDLASNGISVVDPIVPSFTKLKYFTDGKFTSPINKQVISIRETSFLSNTSLKSFSIGAHYYVCKQDICKSGTSSSIVSISGPDEIAISGIKFERTTID
jgi:hypothetical protein